MPPRYLASLIVLLGAYALPGCTTPPAPADRPLIGVAFLVHGGFEEFSEIALWDSTLQIFAYDPNSFVYQKVIWNPATWPMILKVGNAPKEIGKYEFEFKRIGGRDPAMDLTRAQLDDLKTELHSAETTLNVHFMIDYVNWIGDIEHLAHPRHIFEPGTKDGKPVTYCEDDWPDCDPERYNTAGTIDRMLQAGVEEIVIVDLTTSGVRFFKSYDVIRLSREVIARHNAKHDSNIQLQWLNDPEDLMRRSYPDQPTNWTSTLGAPDHNPTVALTEAPNPVSSDPGFALLHAEGIEAQLNSAVPMEKTGVLLINHATRKHNQLFDPKIDDTLVLNENIRASLLARNPGLSKTNIVGAWMGVKEQNPNITPKPPAFSQLERSREMRGENLGYAYLYETDEQLPSGDWGYRYWAALNVLKAQGVEHIIVAFPQITVDSVLNLVELPNQIGKEIGYKNWLYNDTLDYETYPDAGHPFADYWGIWVERECRVTANSDAMTECCFEMGGCTDGRPYPPPRMAPPTKARDDLDPSLAYDVSEFGHLGYQENKGKPDISLAVQDQYRGTWSIWSPPNDDPRVAKLLAAHIINYVDTATD
jgi:hypothetical protein